MSLEQEIKDKALALGFDAVGITDAAPVEATHAERFRAWLEAGFAGQMQYMHRNVDKRLDPGALLSGARSVVVVALNYKRPDDDAENELSGKPAGTVVQYACYVDYHDVMRPLLHELADFVRQHTRQEERFKVCVDSAPLAERALAMRAGLGFIGRSHVLIHPKLGPQILLGELVTTVELHADEPTTGTCVGCKRCVHMCPTGALRADGRFDANRCISYLTMEHRDTIVPELATLIGDRLFGCDVCVLACPYRHIAPPCANERFRFYPERQSIDLQRVLEMTPEAFEAEFATSPIQRLGLERLQRNARICMENLRRG